MADVFISYSSADSAKASAVLNNLENAGISCWVSHRDIQPGADYAVEIPKAIIGCSYYVLLLSNAAQDSPYVMLELDQAFKQKKNIIPMLLEEVIQNEKTNFFLNAKQHVDATKDISAATKTVIARILPSHTNLQHESERLENPPKRKTHEIIRCPYCHCSILQKNPLFLDVYLYPDEVDTKHSTAIKWIVRHREQLEIVIAFVTLVFPLSLFATILMIKALCFLGFPPEVTTNIFGSISNSGFYLILLLSALYLSLFILYLRIKKAPCVESKQIISALSDSGLKYHTFKCVICKKVFSAFLPKDSKIEDHVEELLVTKH